MTYAGYLDGEYAYWPGVDQPHSMLYNGSVYLFAMDQVSASVRGVVRASDKAVVAQYGYTPYGQLLAGSFDNVPVNGNPLRFAAREFDPETRLYYFRARFYDPALGRFISEDPLGVDGGINLYAFAGDDPVNGSDPSGAFTLHWGIKWRQPWRDLGNIARAATVPTLALLAIGIGPAGWGAAFESIGAMVNGSALAAGVETVLAGGDFGAAFRRNINLSAANFLVMAVAGGGIVSAGAKTFFTGHVETRNLVNGAITGGMGTAFDASGRWWHPAPGVIAWKHELGHSMQFLWLSGIKKLQAFGLGPWVSYVGLGYFGYLGQEGDKGPLGFIGCGWDALASGLGGAPARGPKKCSTP